MQPPPVAAPASVYGQVSDNIFTDVTRNDGTEADEDCVDDVLDADGLLGDDEDVVLEELELLESIVPVTSTLWFRCWLRFASALGTSR